jgi:hypothetical protein
MTRQKLFQRLETGLPELFSQHEERFLVGLASVQPGFVRFLAGFNAETTQSPAQGDHPGFGWQRFLN